MHSLQEMVSALFFLVFSVQLQMVDVTNFLLSPRQTVKGARHTTPCCRGYTCVHCRQQNVFYSTCCYRTAILNITTRQHMRPQPWWKEKEKQQERKQNTILDRCASLFNKPTQHKQSQPWRQKRSKRDRQPHSNRRLRPLNTTRHNATPDVEVSRDVPRVLSRDLSRTLTSKLSWGHV